MDHLEQQNISILVLKINTYLEDHELSLRQFAEKINMSCSTLSRIMNGKQKVNISQLRKLNTCISITMEIERAHV